MPAAGLARHIEPLAEPYNAGGPRLGFARPSSTLPFFLFPQRWFCFSFSLLNQILVQTLGWG
ncbi:hypothetical protein I7I50_04484 [Histoplasma capsulatum G186AR]|uniref:Uncharacterized protein n=1 Tax=Ajellomyces capsulatus TaxID=5037 RepID=A0A8H8CZ11_AJECA|nr:hypothetical protein I7I52_05393 [Histoplasma capsulatum]QSS75365.1 hypothetical protein I7I50_04484 [Histoplasma capsulatum G186AR]